MIRLWTYLTLNAAGEPTVAGTYYDPLIIDLDVESGQNNLVQTVRDGTQRIIHDPMIQFEVSGTLLLGTPHVDEPSTIAYLGLTRYLGSVLYYHHREHLPICLFLQSHSLYSHQKAYVARILRVDPVLTGRVTTHTEERVLLTRSQMPSILSFQLSILLDGLYTDLTDITTAAWNARS